MILKSKKIKSVTVSVVSPSICHEVMGPDDSTLMAESEEDLKSFLMKVHEESEKVA